MKHTASARVDRVIDAQTILMTDGKIIRLSGIDYPYIPGGDTSEFALKGKERLEKLLPQAAEVMIWQSRNLKTGRTNRMGHALAHIVTKKDGAWINGTLVREGLAFTMTDIATPDMASQLYANEDLARKEQKGLWVKDSPYGVLPAADASKGDGMFRIVEGTVARAASSKNNLFLNFGNDMRKDFTVMISPALRKTLARRGIDLLGLSGKKIRVRGWIRQWNGPFMELDSAERLEVLSSATPTDLSPASSPESDRVQENAPSRMPVAGQGNP